MLIPLYKKFNSGRESAGYPKPYPSKLESFAFIAKPRLLYNEERSTENDGLVPL
jgi:hypothetical protein